MKLLLSLLLTVACLDRIYCASIYEDPRGHYTEKHTSYVKGYNASLGLNLGGRVGYQDGVVVLESRNSIDPGFNSYNDTILRDFDRPADAIPPQETTFRAPYRPQNTPTSPVYYQQGPSYGQMYGPVAPYVSQNPPIYAAPTGPIYNQQPPSYDGSMYGGSNGQIYGPPMGPTYGPPMGGGYRPTGAFYGQPTSSMYRSAPQNGQVYGPPNGQMYGPPNGQMYVPENGQTNGYPTGSWYGSNRNY